MRTVDPVVIDMVELQKRLAQAERAHAVTQELLDENVELRMRTERERDAAIKERDVAKVVANDCDLKMVKAIDERDAALAKAETAYEDAERRGYLYATLRARIEALADEWDREGMVGFGKDLRALLQPLKPETALDLLEKIEHETAPGASVALCDYLAKLRALLEAQEKAQ